MRCFLFLLCSSFGVLTFGGKEETGEGLECVCESPSGVMSALIEQVRRLEDPIAVDRVIEIHSEFLKLLGMQVRPVCRGGIGFFVDLYPDSEIVPGSAGSSLPRGEDVGEFYKLFVGVLPRISDEIYVDACLMARLSSRKVLEHVIASPWLPESAFLMLLDFAERALNNENLRHGALHGLDLIYFLNRFAPNPQLLKRARKLGANIRRAAAEIAEELVNCDPEEREVLQKAGKLILEKAEKIIEAVRHGALRNGNISPETPRGKHLYEVLKKDPVPFLTIQKASGKEVNLEELLSEIYHLFVVDEGPAKQHAVRRLVLVAMNHNLSAEQLIEVYCTGRKLFDELQPRERFQLCLAFCLNPQTPVRVLDQIHYLANDFPEEEGGEILRKIQEHPQKRMLWERMKRVWFFGRDVLSKACSGQFSW